MSYQSKPKCPSCGYAMNKVTKSMKKQFPDIAANYVCMGCDFQVTGTYPRGDRFPRRAFDKCLACGTLYPHNDPEVHKCEVKERQLKDATKWWSDRVDSIIKPDIAKEKDGVEASFKWCQLVWQEIMMYINLGEASDFNEVCERRGFNEVQRKFLRDALVHVGVIKKEG